MPETSMISSLIAEQPELFAIAIVVVGFFIARAMAGLLDRTLVILEKSVRKNSRNRLEKLDLSGIQPVLHGVVYYATLVFFVLLSLRTLSISVLQGSLDAILGYIPQLLLAGLIILSGYLLGIMTRQLVAGFSGQKPEHLLPRFCQMLVMTAAVLTGLGQMAIDISFITDVIVILLAAFVGGLALAFALGSGQLVSNILARRGIERYRIGSRIRINDFEGRIIEILSTAVVIESKDGITTIPTAQFASTEVTELDDDNDDESDAEGT